MKKIISKGKTMEHEVTYTFSRALHMMRYGGKKMKRENSSCIYYIHNEIIYWKIGAESFKAAALDIDDIMGSWVEVKNEIH